MGVGEDPGNLRGFEACPAGNPPAMSGDEVLGATAATVTFGAMAHLPLDAQAHASADVRSSSESFAQRMSGTRLSGSAPML
jgi:hypothetical protein